MKRTLITLAFFLTVCNLGAQILPGTLDVTGMPNFRQTLADLVSEAGQDDAGLGFETSIDETLLTYTLDPSIGPLNNAVTSEENCEQNIYRYKVFIHRSYNFAYEKTDIQVRTFTNAGIRYPENIAYDDLMVQPLGPRNLTPENGGQYISIPDDASQAIKIFEFVGCRTNIPLQFKILPSTLSPAGANNIEIFYTIVGSTL